MPPAITYEEVNLLFEKAGCVLLTSKENYVNSKQKLDWKCVCGKEQQRSLERFKQVNRCRTCKREEKDGVGYDEFVKLLEAEGWEMVDDRSKYENVRTLMTVKTDKGRVKTTSLNRFKNGFRDGNKDREHTQAYVKEQLKLKGFSLAEGEVYVNNRTPFRFICSCGNISEATFQNLNREDRKGCSECSNSGKPKVDWSLLEHKFEKAGCTLLLKEENYVNNYTPIPYICYCGNQAQTSWKNFNKGTRCHDCGVAKRKETNLEKYGAENVFASEAVKEKIKNYYREHFGVDHNSQLKDVRDKREETSMKNHGVPYLFATEEVLERAKQAHIEKYGAPPGHIPEIREKQKATCRQNLGVDYPLQSKDVHDTIKENNKERYGHHVFIQSETGRELMMERYGHHNFLQSESGKKLMMERYGVEYAMQCPEIFSRAMKSMFSTKLFVFPSGRGEYVQGYEPICIQSLLDTGFDEDDIVVDSEVIPVIEYKCSQTGKNRRYFPDIFIPSKNLVIEVKSVYTYELDVEKNEDKWAATAEKWNMLVYMYNTRLDCQIRRYTTEVSGILRFMDHEVVKDFDFELKNSD